MIPECVQKPACDACGKVSETFQYTGWNTDTADNVWLCDDCFGIAADEE